MSDIGVEIQSSITYMLCSAQGITLSAVSSRSVSCFSERCNDFWTLVGRFVVTMAGLSGQSSKPFLFEMGGEVFHVNPVKKLPFYVVVFSKVPCAIDLLMLSSQISHILFAFYEVKLREIHSRLDIQSQYQLNHGTFSDTMGDNSNSNEDLNEIFSILDENFILPILSRSNIFISWQSYRSLLFNTTPSIFLLHHNNKPTFTAITTTKINDTNIINYRAPSFFPCPLLNRAWVEVANTCMRMQIQALQLPIEGSSGQYHTTQLIGFNVQSQDTNSKISNSNSTSNSNMKSSFPISNSSEFDNYMLLISTISTVDTFSLGMLIPKREIIDHYNHNLQKQTNHSTSSSSSSVSPSTSTSTSSSSHLFIGSLQDLPPAIRSTWMSALRRMGAMFPPPLTPPPHPVDVCTQNTTTETVTVTATTTATTISTTPPSTAKMNTAPYDDNNMNSNDNGNDNNNNVITSKTFSDILENCTYPPDIPERDFNELTVILRKQEREQQQQQQQQLQQRDGPLPSTSSSSSLSLSSSLITKGKTSSSKLLTTTNSNEKNILANDNIMKPSTTTSSSTISSTSTSTTIVHPPKDVIRPSSRPVSSTRPGRQLVASK